MKKPRQKREKISLIRLEPIINIIKCAIWTGKLSDEKPISLMLIAEQESAKTEALKFFRGTKTLVYMSDLTSRGLTLHHKEIEGGKLRHVVLLDLVRILAHGKGVSERTIQTLASLMEEGESENADAGGKTEWQNFPKIGALMGITPAFYRNRKGRWRQTGFLTRFLPVCFHYTPKTVKLIHEAIANGHKLPEPAPQALPEGNVIIRCDPKYSKVLSLKAEELGSRMKTYGFRYHRILRAMAKSQAMIEGRGAVDYKHVQKVLEWSEFFTDKEVEL